MVCGELTMYERNDGHRQVFSTLQSCHLLLARGRYTSASLLRISKIVQPPRNGPSEAKMFEIDVSKTQPRPGLGCWPWQMTGFSARSYPLTMVD